MSYMKDPRSAQFVIEMSYIRDGRKVGILRPNDDGYYTIPLAIIGAVSLNKTFYDVDSFVNQLTSKDSFINKILTDGKLFAEYGHPDIALLDERQALARLVVINEKMVCCHIRKVWTGENLASGGIIVYGEVKPTGPYGQYLQQSLDDPFINTSFSLRSIAGSRVQNGIIYRTMKKLVTFDFVCAGGFAEAAKRYSPSVENFSSEGFSICRDIDMNPSHLEEIALESFTQQELSSIFETHEVTVKDRKYAFLEKRKSLITDTGEAMSVYQEMMRG